MTTQRLNDGLERNPFLERKHNSSTESDGDCIQMVNGKTKYADVDSDDANLKPDDIIRQLGGCGLFQILLAVLIQSMKLVVCWGMGANSFFAYVPRWRCAEFDTMPNSSSTAESNVSGAYNGLPNTTIPQVTLSNITGDTYWDEKCTDGTAKCIKFEYENTIYSWVPEFDLICDQSWVTATVISVQMLGMMVGSILVGDIADIFGRKKPFVLSMAILCVFNLICYFSVNWIMLAVGKFFIGIGSAFFLSIYCIMQGEYTLSKWRSTAISFPSWAIELSLFTLVAWLLHDWEHMTLIITIASLGYLSSWFFIPESFRWYVARNRIKDARKTINQVSKWNKRPLNDQYFSKMCKAIKKQEEENTAENYSLIVLFRKWSLLKLTLPSMTCWLTLGVINYGISFGIKKLSGNFFLNLFFFAIVAIPSKVLSIYLQVRCGRKFTAGLAYTVCLTGGLVVGIVQYIDTPYRGGLTNYFALAASAGVDAAWGPMQTLAVELYPTVARNTAFGFLSTLARFGAVIGPQFVYLEEYLPGLLYFVIAVLSAISIISIMFLPETRNTTLVDKLSDDINKERRQEIIKMVDT